MQKSLRIEDWAARCIEFLSDNLAGQLCSACTVGVPPHTVYGQDQSCVVAGSDHNSILVFLSIT